MLQNIKDIYGLLTFIQLFPEVMVAALCAYFIIRQRYGIEKWAVWVPVVVSYIGQMAFAWPSNMEGIFRCFTMGMIQAGVAIGLYSFLDKYGITDRFGKLVQKKMEVKDEKDPSGPPVL